MLSPELGRRALLQAGTAAIGTLAFGFAVSGPAPAAASPASAPLAGSLVAWVVLRPDAGIELRLAHFGDRGEFLGQTAPVVIGEEDDRAPGSVHAVGRHAERLAVAAAARSWAVPVAECAVEHGRICHRTGRAVGYAVWIDVA